MLAYFGAVGFGTVIGWYIYYINRYRRRDVQLGDLATVVGLIGGGAVAGSFNDPKIFGAYGLGVVIGFFGYLLVWMMLVRGSGNCIRDWFLDGRRKRHGEPFHIPGERSPAAGVSLWPPAFSDAVSADAFQAIGAGADRIIRACKDDWPATKGDCSAFVRDVAAAVGVTLSGNADSIVDQISGAGWRRLANGRDAKAAAGQGLLVIGGLKGGDQQEPSAHGHVVVVVAGPLARGLYPTAYWGRLGSVGEKARTLNWAWRAGDRDRIVYAAHPLA